jgi:hypothetical protein
MVEEILKTRAEQIYHQNIVESFLTEVINIRYTRYAMVSLSSRQQ